MSTKHPDAMSDRWVNVALVATVAQIAFELRYTLLGLSNLQWTFIVLIAISVPLFLRHRHALMSDPLVRAAAIFVIIQWLAASYAPEFHANAFKAAIRFTAGLLLLLVVRVASNRNLIWRSWIIASTVAAMYALVAYWGFGLPWLFRDEEFYVGQIQRLSGSFGYPNIAATYFAMSMPIVWWSSIRPAAKWVSTFSLWSALILTLSRGALAALVIVLATVTILSLIKESEARRPVTLIVTGIASFAIVIFFNPYLIAQFAGSGPVNLLGAEYWNRVQQQPGVQDELPITIRNTGVRRWPSQGRGRVAVSFRYLDVETNAFLRAPALVTNLPHDVEPGETVNITARFQVPDRPGKYLTAFELFRQDFDWFSRAGVIPLLVEADIRPAVARSVEQADLSRWYQITDPPAGRLTASVPRFSLWRAALKIFAEHPFGVGPDNYRLEFGKYLGATRWDTHLYSNSLYLELLTGSGILGLAAFGLIIKQVRWQLTPACIAVGVFLVHGLLDVFLMTTPIYFAFWILTALTREPQRDGNIVSPWTAL